MQLKSLQRARDIRGQLGDVLDRLGCKSLDSDDTILIRRAFLAGFFKNVAVRRKNTEVYIVDGSSNATIHPSSCLAKSFPEAVFYSELLLTSKKFLRYVSEIDLKWLTARSVAAISGRKN